MYDDKYSAETILGPSMAVVRARHRAAMDHRCHCGKLKDPTEVKRIYSRTWIACHRCLGQIKQLLNSPQSQKVVPVGLNEITLAEGTNNKCECGHKRTWHGMEVLICHKCDCTEFKKAGGGR